MLLKVMFARIAPWNELRFRLFSLARLLGWSLLLCVFQAGHSGWYRPFANKCELRLKIKGVNHRLTLTTVRGAVYFSC